MSARTVLATQRAKVRKHRKPLKHFSPKNAFDQIQKALQQAEEEETRRGKSIPSSVQEFN